MTPKEKAAELRNKMHAEIGWGWRESFNCALIVVDEIIEQWEYVDTYIADLGGELNPNLKYWYEVKKELEDIR